jgi:hypothetical protein
MRPQSRREHLLTETVEGELVIYDELTHDAHRLSSTAAWVWRMADGERSLPDLVAGLREAVTALHGMSESAIDEDTSEELVRMALGELGRVRLLVRGLPPLGDPMSRREMIGVTAALLPIIASIVAPTPLMAQFTGLPSTTVSTTAPTTSAPVNLYAEFNGTYAGDGSVSGTVNPCGFGSSPIVTVLDVDSTIPLLNSLSIRHVTPNQTFVYNNIQITVENSFLPNGIVVNASGPALIGGQTFQVSNSLSFGRSAGVVNMNGTQGFTGAACGNFSYSIMGRK